MVESLRRAFAQLPDPVLRRALVGSVLGACLATVLAVVLSWWLVASFGMFGNGIADTVVAAGGAVLVLIGALIFFPSTVMIVAGFFLDSVADAVDARYWPNAAPPRQRGLREVMVAGLSLLAISLTMNLILLPVYAFALFIPGLGLVLFYCLNGYLFGREFFDAVATRSLNPADARAVRRRYRGRILLAGVIITVLTTVPILNLAAPILATAFMTNLFRGMDISARTE